MRRTGSTFRRSSIGAARRSINSETAGVRPPQKTLSDVDVVSYYSRSFADDVDVRDAQDAAISRLSILEIIDDCCPANCDEASAVATLHQQGLKDKLVFHGLSLGNGTVEDLHKIALRDSLSHHILRIALGAARLDLRSWFVTQERRLFLFRLSCLKQKFSLKMASDPSKDSMQMIWAILERGALEPLEFQMISADKCPSETIPTTLKQQQSVNFMTRELARQFWSINDDTLARDVHMRFVYKVSAHTPEIATFIRQRLCYLKRGEAYISRLHIPYLLLARFTSMLNQGIDHLGDTQGRNMIEKAHAHPQLGRFLKELPNAMSSNQTADDVILADSKEPASVSAQLIPQLIPLMPFCARRMLDSLNKQRHLRHFARLQLALFLKDIKMPVNEQIKYWSQRWDDPQKFEREHVYTIRYQYGLEGKRQERSMYACRTMLSSAFPVAGSQDVHGCPYRELKEGPLRSMLSQYGVSKTQDVEEICNLAKNHEFQRACQQTFVALHPGHDGAGVGNHPVQYYRESCNYCAKKNGGEVLTTTPK